MSENKPYNCENDYNDIMGMWDCLVDHARFIDADHEMHEMDEPIVEFFYEAMARTFRFLKLNRPENDDHYTRFDLGLYGAVTAYSQYFPGIGPSVKAVEAYFYEASIRVTDNLRRCFFDRSLLDNSIVYADVPSDPTPEDIEIAFNYDFENGDLLPIAKKLQSWDGISKADADDWEIVFRRRQRERLWENHQN